jgi:hypothetical protein
MLIKSDKSVTIKRIAEEWCAKDKPSALNFVVRNVDAVGIRVFFCSQLAMFCQYMIVSLKFVALWWICTAFGERKAAHGAGVLASMEEFNEILYPKNTIRL